MWNRGTESRAICWRSYSQPVVEPGLISNRLILWGSPAFFSLFHRGDRFKKNKPRWELCWDLKRWMKEESWGFFMLRKFVSFTKGMLLTQYVWDGQGSRRTRHHPRHRGSKWNPPAEVLCFSLHCMCQKQPLLIVSSPNGGLHLQWPKNEKQDRQETPFPGGICCCLQWTLGYLQIL